MSEQPPFGTTWARGERAGRGVCQSRRTATGGQAQTVRGARGAPRSRATRRHAPTSRIELLDVGEGLGRRVRATNRANVEGFVQGQQRTANEGVLRLDQVAGVQVERSDEFLGRLDRGSELTFAAHRIEDDIKRVEPITAGSQ